MPMKRSFFFILFSVGTLSFSFLTACSDNSLVDHKRDEAFYQSMSNSSTDLPQAETKMADLKVLESNEVYPMRIALFDNNEFYYQIDRLGNGKGTWKFNAGALELFAKRPIFDMNFVVSAAQPEGDALVIRFIDRFGLNRVDTRLRDPKTLNQMGIKPEQLREFTKSNNSI